MSQFDHFDFLAPIYDRVISLPDGDHLAQAARLPIQGRLLDAGGGTGRIAQTLRGQAGQIILSDISIKMLGQALKKGGLQAVGGVAENLPFPDHSFERVIMVDAYHHLVNQHQSMLEIWRVLEPGGLLVIEEPDILEFRVKLVALAEKLALFRSHFVRAERIAARLQTLDAVTEIVRQPPNVWIIAEKPR